MGRDVGTILLAAPGIGQGTEGATPIYTLAGEKAVRTWRECPPEFTLPAKLAGTPIGRKNAAKMGHQYFVRFEMR